jgi:hypothetical protein
MKTSTRVTRRIFLNIIRYFNKYFFNRLILWFAKRNKGPFSIIVHKGRRSGRIYKTPVLASFIEESIVIPLSYGENVDWLRNVLAHDGCEIIRKDVRIIARNPVVIKAESVLAVLPEGRSDLFERFDVEKFLHLTRVVE